MDIKIRKYYEFESIKKCQSKKLWQIFYKLIFEIINDNQLRSIILSVIRFATDVPS